MLISFYVRNFRSIAEEQIFSMSKELGSELEATHCFYNKEAKEKLVKSSAIFGPNASGKSNLLLAINMLRVIVLRSARGQEGEFLPITPFLLAATFKDQPTEFEIVFISENVKYQYGMIASANMVLSEWLYAFPKHRPQQWFGREYNAKTATYDWKKCQSFDEDPKQIDLWQKSTRNNALFLSTAIQLNSKLLRPVFNWFKDTLRFAGVDNYASTDRTAKMYKDLERRPELVSFIKAADLNIYGIEVEARNFSVEHLPDDMPESLKKDLAEKLKDREIYNIQTLHRSNSGEVVAFDLGDESDGTQKLFNLAGPWIDALKRGHVLLIDEIHNNLHPKLLELLVNLFNSELNEKGAQLVFTTHDTNLLHQGLFRRDQFWFCEKNKEQSSTYSRLTDFRVIKDRENIESNYLAGRYGALPIFNSFKFLKD